MLPMPVQGTCIKAPSPVGLKCQIPPAMLWGEGGLAYFLLHCSLTVSGHLTNAEANIECVHEYVMLLYRNTTVSMI